MQHMAAQKVGFMPRPIRYGSHDWQVSSSAALECISELSLKPANYGTHTLGACGKHTHFGPQCPPSEKNHSPHYYM
jgi:hypothetical protein